MFLAHPHTLMSNKEYSNNKNWINNEFVKYLEKLRTLGIDGIETNYSSYGSTISSNLSELAKKLNLLESGGTDYHGDHKPCLLYTSPSPRDLSTSRMPSSA